jgi:iron(II)-dependent oxidoreductase
LIAAITPSETHRHEALRTRLAEARALTDSLWDLLRPGVLLERPIPDRHRLIFYLGHLEAFDWNLIARRALDAPSFHPSFDRLFEFGIDPEPGALPEDSAADWPTEAEIRAYNVRTRATIDRLFHYAPPLMLEAALEHRLMHAETLAYLLHNLPYEAKLPMPAPAKTPNYAIVNPLIEIPAGPAFLGKHEDETFGWDNEFRRHAIEVSAFRTSHYKITNAEYLEFVEDGAPAPHFWVRQRGEWFYRGMFQLQPLPLAAPVYVTQRQAAAYAAWAGQKLMTEAQFHRIASNIEPGVGNYDFVHWDPIPVNHAGTSPLIGNGWEWTRTPFAPFPGFQAFDFYPGYSANFFDGQHFVLKGASPRTAACFLRPSYRNWFRPDYPYVYATFRVVEEAV